jgi:predicted alpha/beta-hydrolase family hydrolase
VRASQGRAREWQDAGVELETPQGIARVHLRPAPAAPRAALVLGHGAGGGIGAGDLLAAAAAAEGEGLAVALVEQPYRVLGRRSPPPAPRLDEAWTAVLGQLRAGPLAGLPVVAGGRSSGARVACRTAEATGAAAVLCLAFPLEPPGADRPSRLPELDGVALPLLVVQGENDRFGMPQEAAPLRVVARVPGDHALRRREPVAAAVGAWLRELPALRGGP